MSISGAGESGCFPPLLHGLRYQHQIVTDRSHRSCNCSHMQQYQIAFASGDAPEGIPPLSVLAESLSEVLGFVADHTARKPIELWSGEMLLGRLELMTGEADPFWRVG